MILLLTILIGWLLVNTRIIYTQETFTEQEPPHYQTTYQSTNTGVEHAYSILGVTQYATDEEIKKAYRKMAMQYHPDRQVNASETEQKCAAEKFRAAQKAYEQIKQIRNIK